MNNCGLTSCRRLCILLVFIFVLSVAGILYQFYDVVSRFSNMETKQIVDTKLKQKKFSLQDIQYCEDCSRDTGNQTVLSKPIAKEVEDYEGDTSFETGESDIKAEEPGDEYREEGPTVQLRNMTDDEMAAWLNKMATRQKRRLARVRTVCDKHHFKLANISEFVKRKATRASLLSNDRHKFTFSFVNKVASNHFEKVCKNLGGCKRVVRLDPSICIKRVQEYFKIVFVRHPLVRLLSAYKDKFVNHHIQHFVAIGQGIIKHNRKDATKEEIKRGTDVTFTEFLKYLSKNKANRKNTHWNFMWHHSRLCELEYGFVGKLETITDDARYLFHLLGVTEEQAKLMRAYPTYAGDIEKLRAAYKDVPQPLLERIVSTYHMDMEMFGYNMSMFGPDIWSKQ